MYRILTVGLAACLLNLVTAKSAWAQDASVDDRIEKMQSELESMRQSNEQMRAEIDELRAQTDDDWLTEARAEEIRGLVSDVLADADARSSLQDDGLTAGWSGNFFLASPDGRFKLQIGGLMQIRWTANYHDQLPNKLITGWENTRTRFTMRGHVFGPDIQYLVRFGITRNDVVTQQLVDGIITLQDAWVRINLNSDWHLQLGQFKIPFMREELVDASQQLAAERSLVNQSLSVDRSQGIQITWIDDEHSVRFATIDAGLDQLGFGRVGTMPQNSAWSATTTLASAFAVAARYEGLVAGSWDQFVDFTSPPGDPFGMLVGVAAFYQHPNYDGAGSLGRNEAPWFALTADLSFEWGGANAFFSGAYHNINDPSAGIIQIFGAVAQGGIYVSPKTELFARFEYGRWDFTNSALPDLYFVTGGFNYYIDGQDVKWTTDLGIGISRVSTPWVSDIAGTRLDGQGANPQIVFRTQFQLMF